MRAVFFGLALACATPAVAQPVAYAWRLDCPANQLHYGPFGSPDACTAQRNAIAADCEQPLVGTKPNPAFLRIADVCRDSLNGRGCDCVYAAYPAKRGMTVLDLYNAVAPVP